MTANRSFLFMAIVLGLAACAEPASVTTTVVAPPPATGSAQAAFDLSGVSMEVHQEPG